VQRQYTLSLIVMRAELAFLRLDLDAGPTQPEPREIGDLQLPEPITMRPLVAFRERGRCPSSSRGEFIAAAWRHGRNRLCRGIRAGRITRRTGQILHDRDRRSWSPL
jgi:hypothetical protein